MSRQGRARYPDTRTMWLMTTKKPCKQGPGSQTCVTCEAPVGEECRFLEAQRAMMAAQPSPAGGT